MKKYIIFVILSSVLFTHCGPGREITSEKEILIESLNEFSNDLLSGKIVGVIPTTVKLREIKIDDSEKKITLKYNKDLSYIPFRTETVDTIYKSLSERIQGYTFSVESMNHPVEDFIPNYYRDKIDYDLSRQPLKLPREKSPVQRSQINYENGLLNKNIVLWHSHGWYYSNEAKRWEWQRPRLFQSVEDLIPLSFTVPYLIPMLENAGANVFVPRERDFQVNEVIVDNSDEGYQEILLTKTAGLGYGAAGYGHTLIPYTDGVNPFHNGDSRYFLNDSVVTAQAEWIPDIPETGKYAVYVSYVHSPGNISDAVYTVSYYGGSKDFIINQSIGGGTWIYLGTFKFLQGSNASTGKVTLNNKSSEIGKTVSADAVRFGGGLGVVARNGNTSGRAKFFEGARYWLQAAGMPDTLVYDLNKGTNDYNDDYQSRGEFANYLKGAPYGPNRNRDEKGLGIPVDLTLAFHTDAGITHNDTTVGTLAIYSLEGADSQYVFPDSVSRLASRDLSDIIQTQIVNDMRKLYDPAWSRRQLREAQYSESFRPNMPGMLLELLSHQNFLDMQFVLDPRFRFDVARAIYKGMLRFLASQYEYEYVIQPLPVKYFSIEFSNEPRIIIRWKAQEDSLEPTAIADKYILYTRINDEDFNSGEIVYGDSIIKDIEPGEINSYKVTAINSGGESFPSEILAAGIPENISRGNVLIVNGFDRISGPEAINSGDFAGLMNDIDDGVPDKYDFNFTGRQYDYNITSQFISNDAPGHGASYSNYETTVIVGNSFDYPYLHGKAILNAGYTFTSMSDESFGNTENLSYSMIDYILGEEKETSWQKPAVDSIRGKQFKAFTPDVVGKLSEYLNTGGNLFISGAYLGTELYSDTITAAFAKNILNIKQVTTHASGTGQVIPERGVFPLDSQVVFNTTYNDSVYAVTAPGSIGHTGKGEILLRYAENQFSAAVGYRNDYGVVGFGFPFETLLGEEVRARIMKAVMTYLGL